jgi:uncharacterized protein (DUF952 family)
VSVGIVHHLALATEWQAARTDGEYRTSTLGATLDDVGFIHASFAGQLAATARRFYAGVTDELVWLVIDTERVTSPVRIEEASNGGHFPHLYGPLPVSAVIDVVPVEMVDGRLVVRPDRP